MRNYKFTWTYRFNCRFNVICRKRSFHWTADSRRGRRFLKTFGLVTVEAEGPKTTGRSHGSPFATRTWSAKLGWPKRATKTIAVRTGGFRRRKRIPKTGSSRAAWPIRTSCCVRVGRSSSWCARTVGPSPSDDRPGDTRHGRPDPAWCITRIAACNYRAL